MVERLQVEHSDEHLPIVVLSDSPAIGDSNHRRLKEITDDGLEGQAFRLLLWSVSGWLRTSKSRNSKLAA